MSHAWVVTLGISGAVVLIATPLLMRVRRSRALFGTPVVGSDSLVVAILVCVPVLVAVADVGTPVAVGIPVAIALWAVEALIDQGHLARRLHRPAAIVASITVVAAGLRLPVTGFELGDAAAAVAVLAVVTALRPATRTDSVVLGWTIAVVFGSGALAGLAEQSGDAALAAGVAGACLGFAAFALPPPAARLRSGGVVLIVFLAAVLALDAPSALAAPRSAAVPLLMLAIPLLDALFAAGARLDRRDRGLVGRLRAVGLPAWVTTITLIVAQLAVSVLAVLAGRRLVPLEVALAGGVMAVLVLGILGLVGRVDAPRGRWPLRIALLGSGLLVLLVVLSVPSAVALWRARDTAASAVDAARDGLSAARDGETRDAANAFRRAERLFTEANDELTNPLAAGGLAVPVLAPNLRAGRDLTDVGVALSRAGRRLTTTADPRQLQIEDGTLPLPELARLEPELDAAARELDEAESRLARIDRGFLVPQIDDAISKLEDRLRRAAHDSRVASEAARVLPAVFGGDGPRRYFLAVQNNAEARANGGFIGNWGIISATDGKLELDRLQRISVLNPATDEAERARTLHAPPEYRARYGRFGPERTWQNVNMSPDLPTLGPVIVDLLQQSGVGPVDGVVTIDPVGLAAILRMTGPVTVDSWPEEITAENVVDITLRQAYLVFDEQTETRTAFLGDVADAAWDAFTDGDLGNPVEVLRELGRAAHEKHLAIWLSDRRAQSLVRDSGAAAALPPAGDDLTLVTTQNVAANKLDVYLHRRMRYRVRLVPQGDGKALALADLDVILENGAPSAGLPQEVAGPNVPGLASGDSRSFVSVYSPLRSPAASLDGTRVSLERQRELDYWVASRYVDVPASTTRTLAVELAGRLDLGRDDRYRLNVVRQPLVQPDDVDVEIEVPAGWHLTRGRGLEIVGRDARRARFVGRPKRDLTLSVHVDRDRGANVLERLERGR